jgi:VWFA-related protein
MGRIPAFLCASVVILLSAGSLLAGRQDPQRPTFRTGVNLVRVDAYPSRDGKIITGLAADDFEVLEDGVPQKIESFQFVEYQQNTPAGERRDPNSQRDGFRLAADPSYRVFVVYLDNLHVDFAGSHRTRMPLITFLNRVLGPKDLFGVMTTVQRPQDLILGQQTLMIEEQLTKYWDWGRGARVLEDDHDVMLEACFRGQAGELIARRRLDEVFSDLEGLSTMLSDLREERKNILIVSNGWQLFGRSNRITESIAPQMPQVGVSGEGKLTLGSRRGEVSERWCQAELQRLSSIDFQQRQRDLLTLARQSNVTFYSLRPLGLAAPATVEGMRADRDATDSLLVLSNNTDGVAVVNTNDLTAGARRIADDLSAAYILGYYPTNAKPDGRIRRITVRLKATGATIRARREYRALTTEEVATMRAAPSASPSSSAPSPTDEALAELKRLRPAAVLHTRGTVLGDELVLTTELTAPEVEAGRWKDGGDVQIMLSEGSGNVITTARAKLDAGARAAIARIPVSGHTGPFNASIRLKGTTGEAQDSVTVARRTGVFGDPLVVRFALPGTPRPAGSVYFRRTERLQVRWPVASALDQREIRVLGRDGVAINLTVALSDQDEGGRKFVVADLNLAPLTQAEYLLEIKGTVGGKTETALLAFRVFR